MVIGFFFVTLLTYLFTQDVLHSYLYGIFFAIIYLTGIVWIGVEKITAEIKTGKDKETSSDIEKEDK